MKSSFKEFFLSLLLGDFPWLSQEVEDWDSEIQQQQPHTITSSSTNSGSHSYIGASSVNDKDSTPSSWADSASTSTTTQTSPGGKSDATDENDDENFDPSAVTASFRFLASANSTDTVPIPANDPSRVSLLPEQPESMLKHFF